MSPPAWRQPETNPAVRVAAAVSLWRTGKKEDALPVLTEVFQIASRLGRTEIWDVLRSTLETAAG